MFVLSVKNSRKVDEIAFNDYKFHSPLLMENAGRSVVDAIENSFGEVADTDVVVISGKGNNGGDGMVTARHLYNRGANVTLFLLTTPSKLKGDPRINYNILKNYNIEIIKIVKENKIKELSHYLNNADMVVDAIFGTGFKGKVSGFYEKIINEINDKSKFIVSIDIPSGINGDIINPKGTHIFADLTVSLANLKPAHILPPSEEYCGEVFIGDIGIPKEIVEKNALFKMVDEEDFLELLLDRELDTHKGTYGHTIIIGGSKDKSGAIALAAKAALRVGSGLVSVAVPESIIDRIASNNPEIMFFPLKEKNGFISSENEKELLNFLKDKTSIVIGPGMGISSELKRLILNIIDKTEIPIVIDADALNNLKDEIKNIRKENIVLTPHPGEFERISGIDKSEIKENRWIKGIEFAEKNGLNLILKGYKTLIGFGKTKEFFINPTGNPGMATGGTGDILSGILGGLLSSKDPLIGFKAKVLGGVFIHSLAADLAVNRIGTQSLIASDIIDYLPAAFDYLKDGGEEDFEEDDV
jgi:NAD(P)H-hydrate epimerase